MANEIGGGHVTDWGKNCIPDGIVEIIGLKIELGSALVELRSVLLRPC